jgi:predicted RNA-binding protein with PIN domain
MAYLIDGYNLMHAMVDVRPKLRPDELHRLRTRFLNDLSRRLGPVAASQTTVVFDAARAPASGAKAGKHGGMTIRFTADADDWIESVLDARGAPRPGWVVVSSDRRIREAARRKRVACLTTDQFLDRLEADRPALRFEGKPGPAAPPDRPPAPSPAEAAFWRAEFRDLIAADEREKPLRRSDFVPTDEEIARIRREVEREDV